MPPFDPTRPHLPPTLPPPPDEDDEPGIPADLPADFLPSFSAPRPRRVIAVGGGRGGVGKTTLTVNLGVYFAQLGREVVVIDTDPFSTGLHGALGLESPPLVTRTDVEEGRAEPVPTTVPGLRLVPTAFDALSATPVRPSRAAYWMKLIQELNVDYVLINLGPSMSSSTLDLFLWADVGIAVTIPEPLAVEHSYRFCRALYQRTLRRALMKERFKLRLVEKVAGSLPPLSTPRDFIAEVKRFDENVAALAAAQLPRITPRLVVSQTRARADLELGQSMSTVSERFLGITMDYLGHIEHDDAVWLTIRHRQPLLVESPTSRAARNVERVARRILALIAARDTARPAEVHDRSREAARAPMPPTLYEALGVARTAADDEIRRAYKRQREIFREGSLPVATVLRKETLQKEQSRIEEAHDTLLDPVRRRAYDLSTYPDDPRRAGQSRGESAAAAAELALLQAELSREINAETLFDGALLRKVRESQGIELGDVAQRTKISIAHLSAIENEAIGDLPATVYVQGFVREIAKYLKLDPTQVSKTYMRRLRDLAAGARTKHG
ncbi:MAG TPA: helix-turn-helix domain-containing protein [Candidatus Nanopelagicales bacterium]|nr:helix-turn-helix domain-containing protein [Candidatus Nanopelagicales bacterium]